MRIRIHCRRGSDLVVLLTLALLAAAVLGALLLSDGRASASPPGDPQQLAVSPRRYYLTSSTTNGAGALTACATGYHMASLWEILDTTNLEYNSTLGWTNDDSGSGPPTGYPGWVRTGYAGGSSITPGVGNCYTWTSSSSSYSGTSVQLPTVWTVAADQTAPWDADYWSCNTSLWVWCVGDDVIGQETYLPNVVKSY